VREARGPYAPVGVARERAPVRHKGSGLWLARYVDADGDVRQCGRFKRKRDAAERTRDVVREINAGGFPRATGRSPTVACFAEGEWLQVFPRHLTHETTLRERTRRVLKVLPSAGDFPLTDLRRAHLIAAQDKLLRRGLAKTTIDGSFNAFSLMLRDALQLEYVTGDVAAGLKVAGTDPRLNRDPRKVERRALELDELYAFIDCVPEQHRPAAWAPAVSGVRPGELFALNQRDVHPRGLIYVHQTISEYGTLMDGVKGRHHVLEKHRRGRFTLWPATLAAMFVEVGVHPHGWLVPSPRGKHWALNNFYADPEDRPSAWWKHAIAASGVRPFTLYDLRHSFSSWLQAVPIPSVEVSAWMGHTLREGGVRVDTTTARIYSHGTGQWREAALEYLERVLRWEAPCQRSAEQDDEKGDDRVTAVPLPAAIGGGRGV